jgi:hypothetical protein
VVRGRACSFLDLVDRSLERFVCERLDPAAVVADEVVMMLPALMANLVARASDAGVKPLDEALLDEQIEDAIDACHADRPAGSAKPVVDLLCGEAALLGGQEVDDSVASAAAAVAGGGEDLVCVLCPADALMIPILIII